MLTYEQAIEKANTSWWEKASNLDIVAFQLFEDRLCMPFSAFHAAIEQVLDLPGITTIGFTNTKFLRDRFKEMYPQYK